MNFHKDYYSILRAIQECQSLLFSSSHTTYQKIMHFEDHVLAKILEIYKELVRSCSFHLLHSPSGGYEECFNDQIVPWHGGWIMLFSRNQPSSLRQRIRVSTGKIILPSSSTAESCIWIDSIFNEDDHAWVIIWIHSQPAKSLMKYPILDVTH